MEQAIADNQHFVYYLFNLTAGVLYGLSVITGLSYQCWNIIVWFGIIPASWIYLVSRKTSAWLNLLSIPLFLYIFIVQDWNRWFDKCVELLYKTGAWIHLDYKVTSVVVCVWLPMLVYFMLFAFFTSRATLKKFAIATGFFTALVIVLFPVSNFLLSQYK